MKLATWSMKWGKRGQRRSCPAGLPADELERWSNRLEKWQRSVDEYGVADAFSAAIAAAEEGWHSWSLQRVLKGEVIEEGFLPDDAPYPVEILITARLNVLERQGRFQEYVSSGQGWGSI